jgi:hypothetical protein
MRQALRLLVLTPVVMAVGMLPCRVFAAAPQVYTYPANFSGMVSSNCGFPVMLDLTQTITERDFSNQVIESATDFQAVLTGPGPSYNTVTSALSPSHLHVNLTTGTARQTGVTSLFIIPGQGNVGQEAGNITYYPDGTVVERGHFSEDTVLNYPSVTLTPELCAALAP